jgi:outer membrane immunogenic protein
LWPFVLAGIEAEGGYLRLKGSASNPTATTFVNTKLGDEYGVIAGRLVFHGGWLGSALLYAKAGAAFINSSSSVVTAGIVAATGSKSITAAAYGAGIEIPIAGNWSAKAEYLYLDTHTTYALSALTTGLPAALVRVPSVHTLKAGLNYNFTWPY